ncbi:MAG: DNA polymerase III subunit delta', partial [Piscinibacter sp.]
LPPAAEAAAWLAGQGVAQAEVVLAASGGQPLDALEWVREGLDAKLWLRLPEAVQRGDAAALQGWTVARAVDALHKLCHDVACVSVGAPARYFPPGSVPRQPDAARLAAWSRDLARAARQAEHPLNAGLMIETLVTRARHALATGAPAGPVPRGVSVHSAA